jgi:hypothetical protein
MALWCQYRSPGVTQLGRNETWQSIYIDPLMVLEQTDKKK